MTELTGRELDTAVAVAMGSEILDWNGTLFATSGASAIERACRIDCIYSFSGSAEDGSISYCFILPEYHRQAGDFALVKREIERRGWGWVCERHCDPSLETRFDVHRPKGEPGSYCDKFSAWANTEEVAGCRAFLRACEAV